MNATTPNRGRQQTSTSNVRARDEVEQLAPRRPWKVYLPAGALDARTSDLGRLDDRLSLTLLRLESLCRDKCYCVYSNVHLCDVFGCPERTLQVKLKDAEEAGLIRREITRRGKTVRYAIFLRRRFDDQRPVLDPDLGEDWIREVVGGLMAQKPAPFINNVVVRNYDQGKDYPEGKPPERQRPENPEPPTSPSPPPPPMPPEPPTRSPDKVTGAPRAEGPVSKPVEATPPALTPGQEQFLAFLGTDLAAEVDKLPAEERAALLEPHRGVFDRIIGKEQARSLGPKVPVTPPPAMPATTAELWDRLPGGPPDWIVHAANDLVRDLQDLRFRPAFQQLAESVWKGDIESWKVVDAHRQATNPGVVNRGALFNHALKNHGVLWDGSRP